MLEAFKKSGLETRVQTRVCLGAGRAGGGCSGSLQVRDVQVPARGRATGVELVGV